MQHTTSSSDWIDISVPLSSGMVHWPGDPDITIARVLDMERGDICNLTKIDMGAHTGTHMDAPRHFIKDGISIDQMPLTTTIGPARVIEIQDPVSITEAELHPHHILKGERLLFKTSNSTRCWQTTSFVEDFVAISSEAALYLAQCEVQLVGVDYLSVGGYHADGDVTHRALLGAHVWIIEGLNLAHVTPGIYDLICLPLKLLGSDGAPARAILRPL